MERKDKMKKFLTDMEDDCCRKILCEWHPTLNGSLKPSDVTVNSNKKIWWHCRSGHEWQDTIRRRSKGAVCPYDTGRIPVHGETDLKAQNPALATEWHPTLNKDLKPSDVTVNSNKKVWWRCHYGHAWQATIKSRIQGAGCPYDSARMPIPNVTDVPTLSAEWHPTRNSSRNPSEINIFSRELVWWQCKEGHEWQATVYSRTNGSGCPYDV
jgi:hypothetical protein